MKHFLFLLLLAAPASADIAIKHTASTSLKVDGAAVQAIRVPSTYAVSGNNMKVTTGEHFGKITAGFSNGVPYTIIKVETPIKLVPDKPRIDPISGKEVDPQTGRLT